MADYETELAKSAPPANVEVQGVLRRQKLHHPQGEPSWNSYAASCCSGRCVVCSELW